MAGQLKIGGNVIATHAGTEGAGTVTLDSSNLTIGSNTTVTMGAGSIGTAVTMSANQPAVKTALNASGDAPVYACRAWVNFQGTGTVAIRDSGNVSSITDDGTGNYTLNFTTDMPDANYSVQTSGKNTVNGSMYLTLRGIGGNVATDSVKLFGSNGANAAADIETACVAVFR